MPTFGSLFAGVGGFGVVAPVAEWIARRLADPPVEENPDER